MKKLIAIALALMLLAAQAAFAESAALVEFDNVVVHHTAEGQTREIRLEDMNATFAIGAPEGVATIQLDVTGGGKALLGAVMQFVDDKVVLGIDGVQRPIASAIKTTGMPGSDGDPMAQLAEMFASLGSMPDAPLPVYTGTTLPKVNLFGTLDMLAAYGMNIPVETDANGVRTASYTISYQQVNVLLTLLPGFIPQQNKAQLQPLLDELNAMTQSGRSFSIDIRLRDDGEQAEVLVDALPVEGGVAATLPAAGIHFVSTENHDTLQVLQYQEGASIPLMSFALDSEPGADAITLTGDVMGQAGFSFALRPSDEIPGAQVFAMEMNGDGERITASATYGEQDDTRFMDFAMDASGREAVSLHMDTIPDGEGGRTGAMDVRFEDKAADENVQVTADIREHTGDVAFRAVKNVENAYDADRMTEADQQALASELQRALAPLLDYLGSLGT